MSDRIPKTVKRYSQEVSEALIEGRFSSVDVLFKKYKDTILLSESARMPHELSLLETAYRLFEADILWNSVQVNALNLLAKKTKKDPNDLAMELMGRKDKPLARARKFMDSIGIRLDPGGMKYDTGSSTPPAVVKKIYDIFLKSIQGA